MRWARFGVALAAVSALAGCTQPMVVDAAEYASDPLCAQVMLAIPTTVAGLEMRPTTSQATAAWGEEFALVARCGVEPPGPTTDQCLAIGTGSVQVDWVISEADDAWVAVTFGRSPALEMTVPRIRADEALGDVLAEVSAAAAYAPPNGLECV